MSATSIPQSTDPRIVRSRKVAVSAGRTLFLKNGYAGTKMEDIAELAGLSKRTLYNIYRDKEELFLEIVHEVIEYAERFAETLSEAFIGITADNLSDAIQDLGQRLALAILQDNVIALRRLLIGASASFPNLAGEYFDRAPGRVISALASGFAELSRSAMPAITNPQQASEQFAYLVVGAPLDRAVLVGSVPPQAEIIVCAREGVETFLARYANESLGGASVN